MVVARCEPTYEELKQYVFATKKIEEDVASLPMRNWNLQEYCKIISGRICCEPTYEELKPSISSKSVLLKK